MRRVVIAALTLWLTTPPAAAAPPAVVDAARSAIGSRYVWGGTNPATGVDCSGLVMWAHAQAGIHVPRTSQQQANVGTPVSRDELEPGDIIVFYPNASHVGIYAGAGEVIHASTPGRPVAEVPIDAAGPFRTARRI